MAVRLGIPAEDVEELAQTWQGDTCCFIEYLNERCDQYDAIAAEAWSQQDAERKNAEDNGGCPF